MLLPGSRPPPARPRRARSCRVAPLGNQIQSAGPLPRAGAPARPRAACRAPRQRRRCAAASRRSPAVAAIHSGQPACWRRPAPRAGWGPRCSSEADGWRRTRRGPRRRWRPETRASPSTCCACRAGRCAVSASRPVFPRPLPHSNTPVRPCGRAAGTAGTREQATLN